MLTTREAVEAAGKRGITVVETEYGPKCWTLDSFWMYADTDDLSIAPHAQLDGFWEAWITAWLVRELLTPGTRFIDVGANHGYYALLAASLGCDTLAFEPQPKFAMLLSQSIKANDFRDRLKLRNAAVGAQWGPVDLVIPDQYKGSATTAGKPTDAPGFTTMSVGMMPLDYFAPMLNTGPLVIKIDAEGAEPMIWAGMQELLQRHGPTTVLMEFTWRSYDDPMAFAEALFAAGEVSFIDGNSEECHVLGPEMLAMNPDFWMLAIRIPGHER